ncbi:ubiquinone biosynthesis methyltransferase UbiE [Lawsonia intracellularis]|uniref:ubiquinone/menaquinone biosynthesis methyltransferase n=1 Tax=Lawsonia intracellularis TaxID=29546 RepID=UPI000975D41A|nr:ubiquinone/menaquinone biosynthesis methyltransferase [Lawsonia intracellularis]OMQ06079.1 ubiquinone biosynthesis methyltransferase UbiE [Lawsonia intracellularis]
MSQNPHIETTQHDRSITSMFGRISRWYDPMNRILSGGLDIYWRHCLVEAMEPGKTGRILDLAAGTLDVAIALHNRYEQLHISAVDLCFSMLYQGMKKLHRANITRVWPITADAKLLPFPDSCIDGVTLAFGIRNIVPRTKAFSEIARVLLPGGRMAILEFGTGKQRIWMGLYNYYLTKILPFIGKLSSDPSAYLYLKQSIMDFPHPDELLDEIRAAGFHQAYYTPLSSGIVHLYIGEKANK